MNGLNSAPPRIDGLTIATPGVAIAISRKFDRSIRMASSWRPRPPTNARRIAPSHPIRHARRTPATTSAPTRGLQHRASGTVGTALPKIAPTRAAS